MDRDTKLKEFAAAVFSHVFREYNSTFELPVKLPNTFSQHGPPDCAHEESAAVLRLCLALRGVFNGLFVKCFESFQRSTQHFMTFLTSRSLKLCAGGDDDVFLSFCMVCAFIAELNLFCLINGCYDFMLTAPKCLQAIFNRRLRKEFFASGGWESLKFFSEHFARDVSPDEVVSEGLLASIKEKLDEDSSDDSSSSDDEDDEEIEDEMDEEESASNDQDPSTADADNPNGKHSSDSELDSEESDSESDESDSEEDTPKKNSLKRPAEDADSSDSEEESAKRPAKKMNGLKESSDSESIEETDSEDEESDDTSSLSEEDSEVVDSESDAGPTKASTAKATAKEKSDTNKKVT